MHNVTAVKILQARLLLACLLLLSLWITTEFTAIMLQDAHTLGDPLFQINPVSQASLLMAGLIAGLLACLCCQYQLKQKKQMKQKWQIIGLLSLSVMCFFPCVVPLYNPLLYFYWLFVFSDQTPAWLWISSVILLVLGCLLTVLFYRSFIRQKTVIASDMHGSAKFATSADIQMTGLLTSDSPYAIYVGAWQSSPRESVQYLRYMGESNVAVFAPPRSGKGAGVIIPNLLSYRGNIIVLDLKLENYHYTAGFRQSIGQSIIKLDFTCTDGHNTRFNPLFEIRQGINEIRDIQNMVDIIADPEGKGKEDHWTEAANDLMVSVILHVLYVEKDKTLTGVRNFMSHLHLNEQALFSAMLNAVHDPNGIYGWVDPQTGKPTQTHPVVAAGARDMLNRSESEQSGITSTLKRLLKLYRDPIIAKNTADSDFQLKDLLDPDKRLTIYINMSPPDKKRLRPLLRLVMNQLLSRLTETWIPIEARTQKTSPTLLIMDEFPQLGRLPFFESALAYTAGYGLRTVLICQDLSQIYQEYGQHQSIVSSCDVLTIYAPNKLETAQHFSTILGSQTITREQVNYSGHRSSATLSHISTSDHEYKRPLLTPDELMRLPFDASIIFKTGHRPIKGKKVLYMQDPVFMARSTIPAPLMADRLPVAHDWVYVQPVKVTPAPVHGATIDQEMAEDSMDLL